MNNMHGRLSRCGASIAMRRKIKTDTESLSSSKSKTKEDWTNPLNVWLTVGTCKQVQGTLNYANIISPSTTDMSKGLCISISSPSADCQKYLVKKDNLWCLPLRLITGTFTWTNPSLSGKYLSAQYNNGGSSVGVTLLFEYKTFGWYINDDQLGSLCNSLNTNRNNVVLALATDSTAATNAVNSYFTNQASMVAAQQGVSAINAQINSFKSQIDTCNTQNTANTASLNDVLSQIKTLQNQISDLQANSTTVNTAISQCVATSASANSSIAGLQSQLNSKSTDTSTYSSAVSAAQTSLTNAIAAMKVDCYNCATPDVISQKVTANDQTGALAAVANVK